MEKINIICKTSIFEQHFINSDIYKVYNLLHSSLNTLNSWYCEQNILRYQLTSFLTPYI